jgi:hypothetical protein
VLYPDSFLVISSDTSSLYHVYGERDYVKASGTPALNNGGDEVRIFTDSGLLVDSLKYTPDWGGSKVSLERRSGSAPSVKANFGDSPNPLGGTPGLPNEVKAPSARPTLKRLSFLNSTAIQLIFSEAIAGKSAGNLSNYQIVPNRSIQLIAAIKDTITLYLSQNLQTGTTYAITITGLKDIFGNAIQKTTKQARYVKFAQAKRGDVVINEILHDGQPEFVELYNTTDQNFNLSGWHFSDRSTKVSLAAGKQLLAGGYLVFTPNRSLADTLNNAIYLPKLHLNIKEDLAYIENKNGQIIDSLHYTPAFGGGVKGKSIERIDPKDASNDPSNFATSAAFSGSTPGRQNSVFQPDKTPPEVTSARFLPNGDIEARFSEFIRVKGKVHFSLNSQPLSVKSFNPQEGNIIILAAPSGVSTDTKLTLTATNLADVRGNINPSSQVQIAQQLKPGDVVINEIMYDPIKNPDDNLPDQSEYIELYNLQDYAVSLEGISLHDAPDENGDVRTLNPVSTDFKFIPAHGYALIYADDAPSFQKSRVNQFFHLEPKSMTSIFRVNRSTLSLASTGDAIFLARKNGMTIDSVYYDQSWQNPNLASTKGISLERINPDGQSNNASNWGSSTAKSGGTPLKQNSLYQEPQENIHKKVGISFNPNPFSPDGDGFQDRLFINYKLDDPNYLVTVQIYDRYGRKVRTLANDKPAGTHGSLIWDGLKDDGSRNRIGIYIVIFKAHDSMNGKNKVFKKTVVLARKLR